MLRVYVIPVMVISFLSDFLLLAGAGRLTDRRMNFWAWVSAALIGAVYRAVCLLSQVDMLNHVMLRLLCMLIMGMTAFGWRRAAVRPAVLFTVLQLALLGIVAGWAQGNVLPVLLGGIVLWMLCLLSRREHEEKIIPVELTNQGRTIKTSALVDTGNMLTDPLTGERVLVVCNELGMALAGLTEEQLADPLQTMVTNPALGLRLMPYRTVGQDNGMLLMMRIDSIKLAGRRAGRMVAFAPGRLSRNREYQALAGGCV